MKEATTIMIVDDDADIREMMKLFLEIDGYKVELAADGLDALKQLQKGAGPSLILLDLMMPRMDGEQFITQMRESRFAKIPVIIISGHSVARKKAEELHAVSCLMKPVESHELLKIVRLFAPHDTDNHAV
jgi:CheY-like chemotaxis protein